MSALVQGTGSHHVIVLNGWFGHAADWGTFAHYLDTDAFTWHFWDYRGYGARKDVSGEFTLEEISHDVCEYIDALKLDRNAKLSLLGHSMGGVYMQRILLDCSHPITSLVGISAVPASGTPFDEQSRQLFESAGSTPASRRAIIDFTTGSRLPGRWLEAVTEASTSNSTPQAVERYFFAWADCDFSAELGTQTVPTYVLTGELDPAVSKDVVQATFGPIYTHLTVEELPDVGHYAIFEHPLGLAAKVQAFLSTSAG